MEGPGLPAIVTRAAVLLLVVVAAWSNAQEVARIGLDETRSGVIPEAEIAHVYVLEMPAGIPHLTVHVDAGGDDADMAVYYGPKREELYYDISIDPYPVFSVAAPPPGRYEIHVLNLLWQDLAYVLEVASSPVAGPPPGANAAPSGDGPHVFTIGVDEQRRGVLAADEIEHVYLLDLPVGVPRITIALDAFGQDIDMVVWDVGREETLYVDISTDPYPRFTMERPPAGRLEIDVLNLVGAHMPYVLQVTTGAGNAAAPPPVPAPAPKPVPRPPADVATRPTLRSNVGLVAPGVEMTVAFAGTPGHRTDWIGLHRVGADDRQHLTWRYTDGAVSGSLSFTAPSEPGRYEFRLFAQNGYTRLARSAAFEVRLGATAPPSPPTPPTPPVDPVDPVLHVDATLVQPSASLTVRFRNAPAAPENWIGLFAIDAGDRQHLRWQYTGSSTSGHLDFSAPSEPGQYEFRLFERNGYTLVATSPAFEVRAPAPPPPATGPRVWLPARVVAPGSELEVAFAGTPGHRTDWIGLHRVGADDRQHVTWRYTDGAVSGSLSFTAPSEPGTYQARLFEQNGYTRLAQSEPFEVRAAGPAPPPASADGVSVRVDPLVVAPSGSVTVAFAGMPGNSNDWVGLYRLGADDRQYVSLEYTQGVVSGRLTFSAPSEPGRYEFRVFAFGGWTRLGTSPAFEVR